MTQAHHNKILLHSTWIKIKLSLSQVLFQRRTKTISFLGIADFHFHESPKKLSKKIIWGIKFFPIFYQR